MSDRPSHLDDAGRAHMVDVGDKPVTRRRAVAEAFVSTTPEVREQVFGGGLPKGDAVAVCEGGRHPRGEADPGAHPALPSIGLDSVSVEIEAVDSGMRIEVTCEVDARTGVEMEALTAASVGALSLYDMIKGLDRGASIGPVRLLEKSGGRSGDWTR